MKLYNELQALTLTHPIALTIGVFDGVHLGHQAILKKTQEVSQSNVVISFSNHPRQFFGKDTPLLYPLAQKNRILSHFAQILFLLAFDNSVAPLSAKEFLSKLKKLLDIDYLVLGYDACLGSDRIMASDLKNICEDLNCELIIVDPISKNKIKISSSLIRELLKEKKFKEVSDLLGRPYSLLAKFNQNSATLNNVLLPPSGLYQVEINQQNCDLKIEKNTMEIQSHISYQEGHILEVIF